MSSSVSRAIRGKNVVITGSNRGIGLQFVKQFLSKGNNVLATTRNIDKSHELNRLAGESDGKLTIATLDVGDPESITKFPSSIPFGHIDVLINNAGVMRRSTLDDVNTEAMMTAFNINAVGPLLVTQQVLKSGKLGGDTHTIVANVTSKMGSIDDNGSGGSYAYRASKCALNIVTKSLSIDMKEKNIDTILLHPGRVTHTSCE